MFGQAIVGIVINALILLATLRLVARDEADDSFPKCMMVAAALVLTPIVLAALLQAHLPPVWIAVALPLIMFPVAVYIVSHFCWVTWPRAMVVVLVFFAGHVAFNLGVAALQARLHRPRATPVARAAVEDSAPDRSPPGSDAERNRARRDLLLVAARDRLHTSTRWHTPLRELQEVFSHFSSVELQGLRLLRRQQAATVNLSVRLLPPATKQTLTELANLITDKTAYGAGWEVYVQSFMPSPAGRGRESGYVAILTCKAVPAALDTDSPPLEVFTAEDVRFVRGAVLSPREGGYLPLVEKQLAQAAAVAGVTPGSVQETRLPPPAPRGGPVRILSYGVRMEARGTLDQAAAFVAAVERDPLVQVESLTWQSSSGSGGEGSLSVQVEWPVWSDPAAAKALLAP